MAASPLDLLCTPGLPSVSPLLIVIAHPDDEIIGVGAQLARWAPATAIVEVTDGAPRDGIDARRAGFDTPQQYAAARRRELLAALACLPQPPREVLHLDIADQRATIELERVIDRLHDLIRAVAPRIVVTHGYEGGHPDHDAVAFAAHALCDDTGAFDLVEFAGYHEGSGGQLVTNRFAGDGSDGRVRCLLSPAERRLKRLMLGCFRTQQHVLEPFRCDEEWLRPAPRYDFTAPPPAVGRAWYDRFNWGTTSEAWRTRIRERTASMPLRSGPC